MATFALGSSPHRRASSTARMGGPARARGRHGGPLPPVERHGLHGIPVVSGMLAAATVLVGLPELLASAAAPRGRTRVRLPLRLPRGRAGAAHRAGVFGRGDGHRHRARGACHARRRSLRVARARVRSLLPLVRGRAARGAPVPLIAGAGAVVRVGAAGDRGNVCGVLPRPRCVRPGVDMGMGACGGGSLGWAAHEVRTWIRGIEGGLDVFAPASAAR